MTVWLVEPTNGVEVRLNNLASIVTKTGRNVQKTTSMSTNTPLVISESPLPHEWQFITTQIGDLENQKRKLSYLEMCGLDILCVVAPQQEAMLGALESLDLPEDTMKASFIQLSIGFVGKGAALGHMREAEDATLGTGAATAVDATASNGQAVELNAQNEDVYFSITQSVWALPLGDYRMYIRAKDSAQVATDCTMQIYNTTDAASVASANKTLTASYAWYSLDFTLDSGESGDAIKIWVKKNTATANTITIDLIAIVQV